MEDSCRGVDCLGRLNKLSAERDIWRLKLNWLFVILCLLIRGVNLLCVVPTNHQFIVNPKSDGLNVTDEDIEPGLEESESFYTLTYTVLFLGHAIGSIVAGLLFNYIPTWYLFLCSTLSFIFGYLLYALATNDWMMILARGLAGIQLGSGTALSFAYFGVSFEKYTENIKLLEKYESKKVARVKKYLFSTYTIGTFFGRVIGIGFPLILAQFPNIPQFRTAGWFCMASGVALLLMQLLLFHGECAWKCPDINFMGYQKKLSSFGKLDCGEVFVKIVVPVYVIFVGGLKGLRYVVNEVLINPIATDSFGFSDEDMAYFFIINIVGAFVALILLYTFQYFKISSYLLTVLGMVCTIIALLIITDWQAIGGDPCTEYSLFHHPKLADQYRLELVDSNISESGMVSVQSLQVVERDVYELAVNKCESAGKDCHWIPNSRVTHRHCSDCQPICRSTKHTLNFIQFVIGLLLFFSTLPLAFTGVYLLLSESVSKSYQGISTGTMTALMGASRSGFPQLLDYVYEHEGKRNYLSMMIQVGIFVPLLCGLLLLYPWLAGRYKVIYSEQTMKTEESEKVKLLNSK